MSELTEIQQKQLKAFNAHQKAVKKASAKYYAKMNGKDFLDPDTGELFEFSKMQLDEAQQQKRLETKLKRQQYHKQRYSKNAERFKEHAKTYRANKKKEKTISKVPLLLTEPVAV